MIVLGLIYFIIQSSSQDKTSLEIIKNPETNLNKTIELKNVNMFVESYGSKYAGEWVVYLQEADGHFVSFPIKYHRNIVCTRADLTGTIEKGQEFPYYFNITRIICKD